MSLELCHTDLDYLLPHFYRLLVIFCIINLLNYMDRGAIASNGVNGSTKSCNDKGKCNPATGIQ